MAKYQYMPLNDNVEEMFIGPFGSSLKNESFVDESDAFCMVYEQKHAIKKTMNVETRYVNREKYEELKRFNIHGGDIIVSCRGTIGETYIVPDDAPLGIMHPSIMKIRLKPGVYNKQYFNLLLRNYLKQHEDEANGSGIKMAISAKELSAALFPVPNMAEQDRVASVFNQVEELTSLRKEQLAKLDQLVKSRFIELFGDSTHSRNRVLLEDISVFVTVGIANSATHAYADNGIVMLRNQNIKENYLDEKDLIYITPDFAEKYGSKQLSENDILVIRTGYPGVACLVPKKYEGCQTFTTLIVRLKDSTSAHANYVCHYINSSFGKDYVEQSKVGVAQQNFGAKALAKMPIVVPPMELQEEFAAFVEQTDKSKLAIQASLDRLELLKKSLMQQYFG